MTKKKATKKVENKRAEPGSGEKHDKHAPTVHAEDATGGIVENPNENENADD